MPPKMTARKPTPKQPMPCALGRESSALTFFRRVLDVLSGFTCSSWQTNQQSLSQTSHPCVQIDQPSVPQLEQPPVCLGRPTISLLDRPATRVFRQTNHQSLSYTSHPCVQVDQPSISQLDQPPVCLGRTTISPLTRPAIRVFRQTNHQSLNQTSHPCIQVDRSSVCLCRPATVVFSQTSQQCVQVDQLSAINLWQINQQCLRTSVQYTDTSTIRGYLDQPSVYMWTGLMVLNAQ